MTQADGQAIFMSRENLVGHFLESDDRRSPGGLHAGRLPLELTSLELPSIELTSLERPPLGSHSTKTEAALGDCFQVLYDTQSMMYLLLDSDGNILDFNRVWAERLGYDGENLIGSSLFEFCHPSDRASLIARFDSCLHTTSTQESWRGRKICQDGMVLWVQETMQTLREPGRDQIIFACRDITADIETEEQLKRYRNQLHDLASEMTSAEERERRRIAEGLHDEIGQLLAIAKLRLGTLAQPGDSPTRTNDRQEVRQLLQRALNQTRSLTFELASPVLDNAGFEDALRDLGQRSSRENGIHFQFLDDGQPKPLDRNLQIILFRTARELLLNVTKHSRAKHVQLSVTRCGHRVQLRVQDDGQGVDSQQLAKEPTPSGGYGIFSIRQRLQQLGGELDVETSSAHGTCMLASVPVTEEAPSSDQSAPS